MRSYERRGVLVATIDGRSWHGVLKHFWRGEGLVLVDASSVDDRGGVSRIAGEVVIPLVNVSHFQTAPAQIRLGDG